MINEEALWYQRGDLVEFHLNLGGGSKTCRGLVLNTAVLFGRGARQVWILDMDGATPEQEAHWTKRKHIVHEEDITSRIPSVVIGLIRCYVITRSVFLCTTEKTPWRRLLLV